MKNAIISKMGQKRILALVLTLALMLSTVFVPAVATTTAIAQIPYIPSDADFSAPAVNCTVNGDKYDAVVTWNAVSGADSYTVTVYDPDGTVAGTATTDDTTATIAAIADYATTTDVYTVQVAAKIGDTTVAASMIARFIPFDASNASLRDYNGSETNGWGDNDPVGGFKTKGVGTNSPDGTAISEEYNLTWQDYTFRNINIAEDAEYLTFWWGTEFFEESNTTMYSNTNFKVYVDGAEVTKTNTSKWTVYYVNSDTGELHSHNRNMANLWYCAKCGNTSDTKWYVAIPLSVYDVTDAETGKVTNPIKGNTCRVQITPNLTVYDITNKTSVNKSDRPFSFDSIGYVKDINKFATQMANMHAGYKLTEKSFGYSVEPEYEISDTAFKAPAVSCVENADSKKLDATVTWDAVNGADNYKVNLYKSNGMLISANSATTTATVSGLSSAASADDIHTVQIVAYKGDTALCASVVEQFVPYDESNASLRDYNGTETDVSGFNAKAEGKHSHDGTSVSETTLVTSYREYYFSNILIAEDANYLAFWVGAEIGDTYQISDHKVVLYPDNGSTAATKTTAWTANFVNSNTGAHYTQSRAKNENGTWLPGNAAIKVVNSDYYVLIPLSAYDVTDEETKTVSNPIKGKTCKVRVTLESIRTYNVSDGTYVGNAATQPFHFDSIGSVKDLDQFVADMSKMHANYKLDDITVTASELPFNATNPGFAAPTFKNTLTDDGISTEFAWDMFPNAATYQLKVYNSMLDEVASIETADLTATVEGLVEKLYYTVQVTALDINGEVLGASAYRKFIAYDNAKYYNIGNDGSGVTGWETGGPTTETPDGTGVRMTSGANWISYSFADVEIPSDSEALVMWVGQNEVEDGSRLLGSYKLRFMVDGNFDNCNSSGNETTVYYISSENGSVVTHNRSVGTQSNLNTWWFPKNHENKFAGVGYVIIPLGLFDSADVESVLGTTTGVRFEYTDACVYNADGSQGSGVKLDNTRYIYMDNIGTISDIDAFVNEFDAFNATYNSEVGYYNTTDTTAVFTATGINCGTLSLVAEGMKYSVDGGENWIDVTGSTVNVTGVTAENDIRVYLPAGDIVDTDTKVQVIDITKPAKPTGVEGVKCTTSAVADGKITGVTADMEYTSNGVDWTTVNGTEITGLASGIYYVRYKANGTALASVETDVFVDPVYSYNAEDLKNVRKCLLIKDYDYKYADVNGDRVVNILDLIRLKKVLAGDYTD